MAASRNASNTATGPYRVSFARIKEPLEVPDLLALQTNSVDWLLGNERWKARVEAARQAIAGAAAEGLLDGERIGRRTRWTLSDGGRRLLQDGAARIYGFMRSQHRWNGNWLVVAVTIPETQRQLRHQLRTRLTWAGRKASRMRAIRSRASRIACAS